ncbi:MAG: energy-coupled thiamine transporter ThiT [Lachnospiraceae bacterium]|nr:energy-coupled thiamine transporter ThiT [Lachnospiraceae bacterium]
MLYTEVVNDWGELTYVPTTLGNILLIVTMVLLFGLGILFTSKNRKGKEKKAVLSVKQLVFCAMAIALGTLLSNLKLFEFPTGGSLTLFSMLMICLPGYFFGVGAGILTGIAHGVLQLIMDPYVLYPMQLVIDYLLAFGALGLSGLFAKSKHGLLKGYIVAVIGRYIFAVLSGYLFFGYYAWDGWKPLPYSLAYNAVYIFAEAAITIVVLVIPPVQNAMARVKKLASE